MTYQIPSPAQLAALLERCGTPAAVIAHGEAVALCAQELASQLTVPVDTALLEAACRLHDMAKGQPDHAGAAGSLLSREGFPALGEIVAAHHDLPEEASVEAALTYLSDKLVRGTERVSLSARFAASREKCLTEKALAAWQRRFDRAAQIIERYHLILPESEVSP